MKLPSNVHAPYLSVHLAIQVLGLDHFGSSSNIENLSFIHSHTNLPIGFVPWTKQPDPCSAVMQQAEASIQPIAIASSTRHQHSPYMQ